MYLLKKVKSVLIILLQFDYLTYIVVFNNYTIRRRHMRDVMYGWTRLFHFKWLAFNYFPRETYTVEQYCWSADISMVKFCFLAFK